MPGYFSESWLIKSIKTIKSKDYEKSNFIIDDLFGIVRLR